MASFYGLSRRALASIEASPNSAALRVELVAFGSAVSAGQRPELSPGLVRVLRPVMAAPASRAHQRHYSTAIERFNEFWGKKSGPVAGATAERSGTEGLRALETLANSAADNVQAQARYLQELHK